LIIKLITIIVINNMAIPEAYKFMQCIPKRFDEEHSEVLIQFLERIFPTFTAKEKEDFVSTLYSHYGAQDQEQLDVYEVFLKSDPSSTYLDDILKCKQRITEQHAIRDRLLHKLNAEDIVPHKLITYRV
jgi:hypothetical protein